MGLLDNTTQQQYYSDNDFGNYQFTSLDDIITQFQIAYVGEGKIIPKVRRADISFHAQRGLQEFSFDTLKSIKAQEITVPATLQMTLPQDYVNYTKISWVDSAGIKHLMYPTSKTSNPSRYQIDSDDEFLFDTGGSVISSGNLITNGNFHGGSDSWDLNVGSLTGDTQDVTQTAGIESDPITDSVGWFWDNNAMVAYNAPYLQAFKQLNVPIHGGEQYTVEYTISGYSSGTVNFSIVDENGAYTTSTSRSANGTYTETITAGESLGNGTYITQTLGFRSNSATALNATIDSVSIVRVGDENPNTTWENYKSATPPENQDDYKDDTYWPVEGSRFGLDPQHAQANGSFYIDNITGKIHFSSNISGKTVILDYISDSLGTDGEMQVHKFAEEAMYKYIAYAILSTSSNPLHQQLAPRFKKERFAETRKAKLRLSNIKIPTITTTMKISICN